VLSALNAANVPLHREAIAALVQEDHECSAGTVYKWLSNLTKQGRITKVQPGVYATNAVATRFREEEIE
jgi:Fe2+ or Zn2+ uptake regulation protein